MNQQLPLSDAVVVPERGTWKHSREVVADVACERIKIVNVVFVGLPRAHDWVLIDAGVGDAADSIKRAAGERFGDGSRPAAIVLTHAHFDHVGALATLANEWDVPVYAHPAEQPFLDGSQCYPPPNPSAGGGLMSRLSPLFPRSPIDIRGRLRLLPDAGVVPPLPGWQYIHTPGHAPGHVSFWREADRTLIAGDAFVTTRQESVYAALTQEPEMHGPPRYFTPDWDTARASVRRLAALDPETVVTGHGLPLHGPEMRAALHTLADDFDRIARPE